MPITLFHTMPPKQSVRDQILKLVEDNVTDLSMLAVPPSNLYFEVYRWALPTEIGAYIARVGQVPGEPVELLVAFDDLDPGHVTGFILYSPVPTLRDACGINYMAVKQSCRGQGIGSELMNMVIARYPHVELTCAVKRVPFYESLGFQVLGSHNTQIVMNTRSSSANGLMAVLDVSQIYESPQAKLVYAGIVQRWGEREVKRAESQLKRHVEQLRYQVEGFAKARLEAR